MSIPRCLLRGLSGFDVRARFRLALYGAADPLDDVAVQDRCGPQ